MVRLRALRTLSQLTADQKREDARCIELTQTFVVEREPLHQLDDHDTERVPLEEKVAQSLPKCRGAHAACQLRCDAARRAMRQLTREPVHRTKTNACRCVLVDYAGDVSFRWVRHGAQVVSDPRIHKARRVRQSVAWRLCPASVPPPFIL